MEEFLLAHAKELGLIDEVGDEFVARELAAKMVIIDPKIQPLTFGKKKKILGLIPGSKIIEKVINNIFLRLIHPIKYFGYISLKPICLNK